MLFLDHDVELPSSGAAYSVIVSDVHLSENNLPLEQFFTDFLASSIVRNADKLIILGNLFDMWIGDDELHSPWASRILRKLHSLIRLHVEIVIMNGNHDFLIGPKFCSFFNASFIADPSIIDLYGVKTVLLHGDSLCTEDFEYQIFRKMVRQNVWQREFLSQTLEARRAIGYKLRDENRKRSRIRPNDYLTISNHSVLKLLSETRARRVVHGHAARPGVYNHIFEGHVIQRWVLPKWQDEDNHLRAGALLVGESYCYPIRFSVQKQTEASYVL